MPISVELGGTKPQVRVSVEAEEHAEFITRFAEQCFRTGEFRARGGGANRWQLDCRTQLGQGATLREAASVLLQAAADREFTQFAGFGFGAYALVGAMLASSQGDAQGALIRNERKPYGTEKLLEGQLDQNETVCIVDDILNSGESACRAAQLLRENGFLNIAVLTLFRFRWGAGVQRLAELDVASHWIADVHRLHAPPAGPAQRPTTKQRGSFWRTLFSWSDKQA